jgi:hypothetical protein
MLAPYSKTALILDSPLRGTEDQPPEKGKYNGDGGHNELGKTDVHNLIIRPVGLVCSSWRHCLGGWLARKKHNFAQSPPRTQRKSSQIGEAKYMNAQKSPKYKKAACPTWARRLNRARLE